MRQCALPAALIAATALHDETARLALVCFNIARFSLIITPARG